MPDSSKTNQLFFTGKPISNIQQQNFEIVFIFFRGHLTSLVHLVRSLTEPACFDPLLFAEHYARNKTTNRTIIVRSFVIKKVDTFVDKFCVTIPSNSFCSIVVLKKLKTGVSLSLITKNWKASRQKKLIELTNFERRFETSSSRLHDSISPILLFLKLLSRCSKDKKIRSKFSMRLSIMT